jgi:hypothetical protein
MAFFFGDSRMPGIIITTPTLWRRNASQMGRDQPWKISILPVFPGHTSLAANRHNSLLHLGCWFSAASNLTDLT